ncbi:MAG: ABC transporter substrate-binding protein [bacterium]
MLLQKAARAAAITPLVLLAACGSDDATTTGTGATGSPDPSPEAAETASTYPVAVEAANGSVTIDAQPERIVSLSPTATETLFAVGAGDQVVAVDEQSDHPAEAPTTDLSGFEPNVEAIAEYEPDLVLAEGTGPDELTDGLDRLEIPVIVQSAATDLDEAYQQIEDIGAATGHADEAEDVVADMRDRIAKVVADLPDGPPLSVFHELGPDLYTASSDTFIGQVYSELGLVNVADEAAEEAGTPYPQVSAEYLLSADPDLVILADNECCGVTPEQVAERPGWDALSAVQNGNVTVVDEDIASRWGPRVPELFEAISDVISSTRGTG